MNWTGTSQKISTNGQTIHEHSSSLKENFNRLRIFSTVIIMVIIRKKEVTNSGKRMMMMVGRAVTLFTPVGVLFRTVIVDSIVDSL